MRTSSRSWYKAGLATLAAAGLLLTACSDDDSGSSGTASADPAEARAVAEFCDRYWVAESAAITLLFTGEGDPDEVASLLDEATAAAPDDVADTMTTLTAGAKEQLSSGEQGSEDTLAAYSDSLGWVAEHCEVETLDVTAVDYGFEGIPEQLSAGTYVVRFTNEGREHHEMFAGRILEGVTETLEKIFELEDEEEVFSRIAPVNAVDASAGATRWISWHLDEPGQYFTACFVSVGSVDGEEGEGPPHVAEGMVTQFTVE